MFRKTSTIQRQHHDNSRHLGKAVQSRERTFPQLPYSRGLAYNAGFGGSNPSPPTTRTTTSRYIRARPVLSLPMWLPLIPQKSPNARRRSPNNAERKRALDKVRDRCPEFLNEFAQRHGAADSRKECAIHSLREVDLTRLSTRAGRYSCWPHSEPRFDRLVNALGWASPMCGWRTSTPTEWPMTRERRSRLFEAGWEIRAPSRDSNRDHCVFTPGDRVMTPLDK